MTTGRTTPPPLPYTGARPAAKRSLLARALTGMILIVAMAVGGAWLMHSSIDPGEEMITSTGAARHELLGEVRSWGYQLQKLDVAKAANSQADLLVVDENFDGRQSEGTGRTDLRSLKALKRKPNGGRRLVLAYLSIGEAEDYRAYWNSKWVAPSKAPGRALTNAPEAYVVASPALAAPVARPNSDMPLLEPTAAAPAWLGMENADWRGNFYVRYWDETWQALILGNENSAINRIIAAGFDGVYLDRADVYLNWVSERASAKADMAALIERISESARSLSPGSIIVMQNAEELLGHHRIRNALDAVAKEDLLFGIEGGSKPNSTSDINSSIKLLKKAQGSGLPVLVVEYLQDRQVISEARSRLESLGFIPYFAPRALDRLGAAD